MDANSTTFWRSVSISASVALSFFLLSSTAIPNDPYLAFIASICDESNCDTTVFMCVTFWLARSMASCMAFACSVLNSLLNGSCLRASVYFLYLSSALLIALSNDWTCSSTSPNIASP